jgi:hypothetical protein
MKFKCKQTGKIVEFTQPSDIEAMLKESHYEAIQEEVVPEEKATKPKKPTAPVGA